MRELRGWREEDKGGKTTRRRGRKRPGVRERDGKKSFNVKRVSRHKKKRRGRREGQRKERTEGTEEK